VGLLGDLLRRLRAQPAKPVLHPDESFRESELDRDEDVVAAIVEDDEDDGDRDEAGDVLPVEAEGAMPEKPARPLYWTEAMCYPPSVEGGDLSWEESETVSSFLARLSLAIGERGAFLTADALRCLAEDLTPARATAVLSEPWMVPVKVKASEAVALARAVAERAVSEFGFERLLSAGLSGYPQFRTEAGFREAVFAGDHVALKALAEALLLIHVPLSCTMATSIDYALACMGDRGAMARVADRLEALPSVRNGAEPFFHGAAADDSVIAADTWRRLSVARIQGRADGVDLAAREIAPHRVDLRRPWELKALGLTMPPASKEAAAAMERQPHVRRKSRAVAGIEKAIAAEARGAVRADDGTANDVPASGTDGEPVAAAVLDGIGAGDGSAAVESAWGHLLEPLRVMTGPDPDALYEALQKEMPWFEAANRKAALAAALAARHRERLFRLDPVLLVGPPGIGKSRWARRVAELSSLPMHSVSLAGASSSKQVIGSERGWASARPSLPAFAFSSTRAANPVVLVDEVDKTTVGLGGDPVEALLPMLEKETARRYPDVYLLGNFDLTRVSFVFTANSVSGMSQAFLDRVEVVNVPKPGYKDYPSIAAALVREAMAEYGLEGDGHAEAAEAARKDAVAMLEAGSSVRNAGAAVRLFVSKSVWSPPEALKLVR